MGSKLMETASEAAAAGVLVTDALCVQTRSVDDDAQYGPRNGNQSSDASRE
jgi:hypothetical protein